MKTQQSNKARALDWDRCFQKIQALRPQVISGMLFKVEIQQMPKSLSLLCSHDMAGNFIKISIKRRR